VDKPMKLRYPVGMAINADKTIKRVKERNQPSKQKLTLYFNSALHKELKSWCAQNDVSVSEVMEDLAMQLLESAKKK
jgi:hypothetical protein